jgi:circadian clock protein KaiC
MQYLQSGAAEHDEPGVFISFSETNEMLCQHGKGFGWDCATLQKRGKLTLAKYTPHEVVEIIESGGGLIRDTIDSAGAKRLVIDSLSAYEMLFENRYKANQSVLGLFDLLRKWNVTTLVTSEFPVSLMKQTKERLGFLTDGIINLYHFRRDGKCVRALEVVKMRDTAHNEDINLFEIGKGGLRVLRGLGGLGR